MDSLYFFPPLSEDAALTHRCSWRVTSTELPLPSQYANTWILHFVWCGNTSQHLRQVCGEVSSRPATPPRFRENVLAEGIFDLGVKLCRGNLPERGLSASTDNTNMCQICVWAAGFGIRMSRFSVLEQQKIYFPNNIITYILFLNFLNRS